MDKIALLQSEQLRKVARHLETENIPITFFGQAWSKPTAQWIYFDATLDLDALREKFNLNEDIVQHENLDPRSGTERGFIDKNTQEGLMGKL